MPNTSNTYTSQRKDYVSCAYFFNFLFLEFKRQSNRDNGRQRQKERERHRERNLPSIDLFRKWAQQPSLGPAHARNNKQACSHMRPHCRRGFTDCATTLALLFKLLNSKVPTTESVTRLSTVINIHTACSPAFFVSLVLGCSSTDYFLPRHENERIKDTCETCSTVPGIPQTFNTSSFFFKLENEICIEFCP